MVAAAGAVGLALGVLLMTGSPSAGAPGDDGLAQDFVTAGRCDGGPGFRVRFHNTTTEEGLVVAADLTVKRAGDRARWDFTSTATTTFTDGTKVTLVGDFGRARSSRKGVLELSTSTPAGVRHAVGFGLTRRGDGATCVVRVRG
jgi:putative component of toxin-antitoxin plasmid stabilization module